MLELSCCDAGALVAMTGPLVRPESTDEDATALREQLSAFK